jgi:hypothetical protein
VTDQGYPPRRRDPAGRTEPPGPPGPAQPRHAQEPRTGGWQALDAFDSPAGSDADVPPWAIPNGVEPIRARRATRTVEAEPVAPAAFADEPAPSRVAPSTRRPGRSRAAATRRRRSRRRLITWGTLAASIVAIVAIIIGVSYLTNQPASRAKPYITTLQKGEFRSVPDACKVMPSAAVSQYLNGSPSKSFQSISGAQKSECTYQVDAKPTFRLLDVTLEAYQPALIAPGDGSATSYAKYTFTQTWQVMAKPPKDTPQPPAKVTPISGLGNQAFSALQVYKGSATAAKNDRATVVVRDRNVLVTISLWASFGDGFGPVNVSELQADAQAAARTVLTTVQAQPTVT